MFLSNSQKLFLLNFLNTLVAWVQHIVAVLILDLDLKLEHKQLTLSINPTKGMIARTFELMSANNIQMNPTTAYIALW